MFGPPGQRVQIILLDIRFFKSPWRRNTGPRSPGRGPYVPDDDPAKTMLGDAQWAWLEMQLRTPADLRLIVSSIETVADGNTYERWANFPREQKKLYDLIAATRANRCIILSGDRHIGALYRETQGTPYPLYEMTSSGLTHSWETANETARNRIGNLYGGRHFGMVTVDWTWRAINLSLINLHGQVVRSHRIAFREIEG
jgi:alkaline phosphatase D